MGMGSSPLWQNIYGRYGYRYPNVLLGHKPPVTTSSLLGVRPEQHSHLRQHRARQFAMAEAFGIGNWDWEQNPETKETFVENQHFLTAIACNGFAIPFGMHCW